MKTEIFSSYSLFCERKEKTINGVSQEFADANPNWAEHENEGCWNCSSSQCSGWVVALRKKAAREALAAPFATRLRKIVTRRFRRLIARRSN